jgi:hypothetical protein
VLCEALELVAGVERIEQLEHVAELDRVAGLSIAAISPVAHVGARRSQHPDRR